MRKMALFIRGALQGLLFLGMTQSLWGGSNPSLPSTNGAFYAISVQDLGQAMDWYTKHLGFAIASQTENETRKGALLKRPGTVLELAEFKGAVARNPEKESHEIFGIFKLGFTTENLDASFTFLSASGATIFFPIVRASANSRTFGVKDMDGNIIQFFGK